VQASIISALLFCTRSRILDKILLPFYGTGMA